MRPAMNPRMIYQMMCNIGSVGRRVLISGRPIVGAEMQRLEDLLLSAVERFEFVNVKVFEGLKFHLDRLEIGVGVRGAFAP